MILVLILSFRATVVSYLVLCSFFINGQEKGLSSKETVTFAVGEWPPYVGETLPNGGLLTHLVSSALETQGIKTNYRFYPWARSYDYLLSRNDEYEASLGFVWSESRDADMFYSHPIYYQSEACFFHLKSNSFDWKEFKDLKKYKIGLTIGYYYGEGLSQALKDYEPESFIVKNDILNFKMLLGGRTDVFPSNKDVGDYILKHYFSEQEAAQVECHPKPYHTANIYAIFPKDAKRSDSLIRAINSGITKIIANGDYKELIEQHSENLNLK